MNTNLSKLTRKKSHHKFEADSTNYYLAGARHRKSAECLGKAQLFREAFGHYVIAEECFLKDVIVVT